MTWYRIRVDLRDAPSEIWRELLVPADLPLPEFHMLLQLAMGWQNSHLHSFARGPGEHWQSRPHWVMDNTESSLDDDQPDQLEATATIATLLQHAGDQATYLYDFGDDWEHLLTLTETLDGGGSAAIELTSPVLTDGAGMCPPEDCGGIPGYTSLLESITALERGETLEEWPEHVVRWAFDTTDTEQIRAYLTFNLAHQQAELALLGPPLPPLHPVLAEISAHLPSHGPESIRAMVHASLGDAPPLTPADAAELTSNLSWFLDLIGEDGVALTEAGYLRPAIVQQIARKLHLEREWIGALNREDQTPGVAEFRALTVELGLARKIKGRLALTKAGLALRSAPPRLLAHIAARLPLGRTAFEHQASTLVMLDLLGHPNSRSATMSRCAAILDEVGWRAGERNLSSWDIQDAIRPTLALLARCGILEPGDLREHGWTWRTTAVGAAFLRRVLRAEPVTE